MSKRKNKRKLSKISLILIIFVWLVICIFFIIMLLNNIKNNDKLKNIKSQIEIPDGFYYVGGDLDSGIVISDNKKDLFKGTDYKTINKLKGNQFVWVPVENAIVNNFDEAEKLVNDGKYPIAIKDGDNYKSLGYVFDTYSHIVLLVNQSEYNAEPYIVKGDIYGDSEEKLEGSTKDLYQVTFNNMVKSVEKHNGFYISRFEIGNLGNAIDNDKQVVSKADQDDITGQSWIDMYKVLKKMYNRDDITTEMIWGCQWDAVLNWIDKSQQLNKYVYESRSVGNYYNQLEKTGSSSEYSLKNIYDLAGNAYEWTQRGSTLGGRKAYGGSYKSDNIFSLEETYVYGITYLWDEVGTRATMYLN